MAKRPEVPDPVRRGLLTGGALAVAASAVTLSRAAEAAAPEKQPEDDPRRLTYRITDHIAAYYRRARG